MNSPTPAQPTPVFVARVRKALTAAEQAADACLAKQLDLMRAIVHTRQSEQLPTPYVGQQALTRLYRAIGRQIDASNDIFRTHELLQHDAKHVIMVGGEEDKPQGFLVEDEGEVDQAA